MAKSEMLIVMQHKNPAAQFCHNCLVGLDHAVLLPFDSVVILKRDFMANDEGSKLECIKKRLHNQQNGAGTIV